MEVKKPVKVAKYVEVIYFDDDTFRAYFFGKKEDAIKWRQEDSERANVDTVEVYKLMKYDR